MTTPRSGRRPVVLATIALLVSPALAGSPTLPKRFDLPGDVGSVGASPRPRGFSTEFDGSENPISESGAWSNGGVDWTYVQKSGGLAFGTQSGNGGYDDSWAVLSGFSPDHTSSGVVRIDPAIDTGCTHEVELLLRWSGAPGVAKGYECNLSFDGSYLEIVRWNGPPGDFTYLASGAYPGLRSGDVFKASAVGNVITVYVNDVEVVRATDDTYTSGNPGIGFFRRDCGTNRDVAFTSYTATDEGPHVLVVRK